MVIFNRSHYEDVLIVRVHNLVPETTWSRRYERINTFEKGLVEHDAHILKFYLHISKREQLKRFKERLDDPSKRWKISEPDYKERSFFLSTASLSILGCQHGREDPVIRLWNDDRHVGP